MTQTCYRHPNRETGVSCSNCGRPICPDCMTPTPVGMRCPECSKQRTRVTTAQTIMRGAAPVVTYVLIGVNVGVEIASLVSGAPLAGSFGALVAQPHGLSLGASGAVFGVAGAAVVVLRHRGIDPMQSGLGFFIFINLLLSFRPGISVGAHIGGLIGGAMCAWLMY